MQHLCNKIQLFLICCLLAGAARAESIDLLYGHYEVQVDYTDTDGWWMGLTYNLNDDFSDRTQIRRLQADETTVIAPPQSAITSTSQTSFLAPAGEPIWLLPQGFFTGHQFLGMRVVINPGVFQTRVGSNFSNSGAGSVAMRLVSVEGSGPDRGGHFALWQRDFLGNNVIHLNSADGITLADEIPTLNAGAHSHFNWGFSAPGEYLVTYEVSGRLRGASSSISHQEVIRYIVPHSGQLSEMNIRVCADESAIELVTDNLEMGVCYGQRRAFIEALTALTDDPSGAQWSCPLTLSSENNSSVVDAVGLPLELANSGTNQETTLTLTGHTGPGDVIARDASDAVLFNSRDGFTDADAISLTSDISGNMFFTATGIHTLRFSVELANGRSQEDLVVRCGAGLTMNYDYAAWAASYEAATGLTAGTLADPLADSDGDGIDNEIEFHLDAAGADPTLAAQDSVTQIEVEENFTRFLYLRDLTKDPLFGSGKSLLPGFSFDLDRWTEVTRGFPGFPLENFENGIDDGNARSPFTQRALRLSGTHDKAFFRIQAR